MSQQALQQASLRAVTGRTDLDYNGDWHALWDLEGILLGTYNERMIRWVNDRLGSTYGGITEALQAFATSEGAFNFSSLGTFDANNGPVSGSPGFVSEPSRGARTPV